MDESAARNAFRLAGIGTSDCRIKPNLLGGYDLLSANGVLIAKVSIAGFVTRYSS